jgi:hypothetical protein
MAASMRMSMRHFRHGSVSEALSRSLSTLLAIMMPRLRREIASSHYLPRPGASDQEFTGGEIARTQFALQKSQPVHVEWGDTLFANAIKI